ncbi:MAG: hypothetical protein PHN88_08075 [Ignavibacteria bacterium]|nr:hypothetical protein [Ignavibacteria bacterium]
MIAVRRKPTLATASLRHGGQVPDGRKRKKTSLEMRIVILFCLLSLFKIGNCSDIEKYAKAYKMIKDSNSIVQKCFSEYYSSRADTFQICISNRIYHIDKMSFIYYIIGYEYNNPEPYGAIWRQLRDTLTKLEIDKDKEANYQNYKEMPALNKIYKTKFCDLKLFFGDFDEQNRLCASLIYDNGRENYLNAYRESQCGIDFLFYFKDDEIVKMIALKFVR